MNRMLWSWLIAAGLLLARLAYLELDPAARGYGMAGNSAAEVTVLILVTAGLLGGLVGIAGWLGMLGWVPRPGQE